MNILEVLLLLVFIVPIGGLSIGFVLCASWMQLREEEAAATQRRETARAAQEKKSAYDERISRRRYVRPVGAMIRAAQ